MVISSGIMIAVPLACTTRPTIRMLKPGEVAAMRVPTVNSDIAVMKIGRVWKRCSR